MDVTNVLYVGGLPKNHDRKNLGQVQTAKKTSRFVRFKQSKGKRKIVFCKISSANGLQIKLSPIDSVTIF